MLAEALELAQPTGELQRIGQVAAALAEAAWLDGDAERSLAATGLAWELACERRERWMTGELALWRARAGVAEPPPEWIAEPFRLEIAGRPDGGGRRSGTRSTARTRRRWRGPTSARSAGSARARRSCGCAGAARAPPRASTPPA